MRALLEPLRETPVLREQRAERDVKCRCGARLPPGERTYVLDRLPEGLRPIVADRTYCSAVCVRAHFLEALSVLDGLDTPEGEEMVSDLREIYIQRAVTIAQLLDHGTTGWFPSNGDRTA